MASRIVACRVDWVSEWSKASPPISYAGSRTAVETTWALPMVRGGRKARSISAGSCMRSVRARRAKLSL